MRSSGEISCRHSYKRYKEMYPAGVSMSVYYTIIEDFNKEVSRMLLAGETIKMPFNLGELYISKKKVNFEHLRLDYGHWRKSGGEKIYHLNRHSDSYHAYFHWKKIACNFTHKTLYKFSPCRANSRSLATIMKSANGHAIYPAHIPHNTL